MTHGATPERPAGSGAAATDGAPRVLLAGGGSAGHLEPALALAAELRRRYPDAHLTLLGTGSALERRVVGERGYAWASIPKVPLPRRLGRDLGTLPVRLAAAVRASGDILATERIQVVVGFGGYVALPAYLAAWRRHVPLVVHEANRRAGIANRVGSRLTRYRASAVPGVLPDAVVTGLPVREEIARLDRERARPGARRTFGLDLDVATLLVTGGSQGAHRLNEAVLGAARPLAAAGIQVLHVAGPANAESVRARVPKDLPSRYIVRDYLDDMAAGYAAADLVLCRSGAMTCAELSAVGLPAVYVPLPIGNGEQRLNAAPIVAAGGGLLIEDGALDARWLARRIPELFADRQALVGMGRAARREAPAGAAARLADLVELAWGRMAP